MAGHVRSVPSKIVSPQSITPRAPTAQDLADQAMREAHPAERARIIEKLFGVLESEQGADALLDSAA